MESFKIKLEEMDVKVKDKVDKTEFEERMSGSSKKIIDNFNNLRCERVDLQNKM